MGTLSFALDEVSKPEVKETRSTLISNILRLGDPDNNPLEAVEITVKTSKCTALARPKSWKRFAPRESKPADEMDVDSATARDRDLDEEDANKIVWAQLRMRTEFHVENDEQEDEDNANEDNMDVDGVKKSGAKVEKEQLVRGFKYGSSYVPCPDGQFTKLSTKMGISISGFFSADNVCPTSVLFVLYLMTSCSFGENFPWARYNTCGQILVHPLTKLHSRLLSKPWTTSICTQLPAGFRGRTRNQRWECLPLVDLRKSTVSFGCRCFVCFCLLLTSH